MVTGFVADYASELEVPEESKRGEDAPAPLPCCSGIQSVFVSIYTFPLHIPVFILTAHVILY